MASCGRHQNLIRTGSARASMTHPGIPLCIKSGTASRCSSASEIPAGTLLVIFGSDPSPRLHPLGHREWTTKKAIAE